jgi:L-threonylcarbamoyladenylate synthase
MSRTDEEEWSELFKSGLFGSGQLIIFPTETVVGLGCAADDQIAVQRLVEIKDRPLDAGFPLIIADGSQLEQMIAAESDAVRSARQALMRNFWPGPLTLVFAANEATIGQIAAPVFGRDYSLAVRVSSLPVARALAKSARAPLIATSANPRGNPPAKTYAEATSYFPNLFCVAEGFFEGAGSASANLLPSTIVDVRQLPFAVLREGAISRSELGI